MTAELIHRLHFAFTITFHYLFPQLTMGLALLIVVLKSVASKPAVSSGTGRRASGAVSSPSTSSSALLPAFPMEFEFGTNWARFSRLSGGVIGQPLAMGRRVQLLSGVGLPGPFLYGENASPNGCIGSRRSWFL